MTDKTKRVVSRRMRALLYSSLALNLLLVGVGAGLAFKGKPERSGGFDGTQSPYVRALDGKQKDELRTHLKGYFEKARREERDGDRRERAEVFRDVAQLLQQTPFDADALRALFATQDAQNADRMARGQQAFLDYLLTLDGNARLAFAKKLEADVTERMTDRGRAPRD